MKICAIDSSGQVASVAVVNDQIIEAEYTIQHGVTHSQTLLPMLDEVSRMIELDLQDLDAFALAVGPGSFTGLRIGAATVKGLGLALDKPVVSVPTLEALAMNAFGSGDLVCPIMDARRHQVYTGIYSYIYEEKTKDYSMEVIMGQSACAFEDLCDRLNELGRRVMFIGDGIPVYEQEMAQRLQVEYLVAPQHMNRQKAGSVASLAFRYLQGKADKLEGCVTTVDEQTPIYLRMSQAEREKKERQSET